MEATARHGSEAVLDVEEVQARGQKVKPAHGCDAGDVALQRPGEVELALGSVVQRVLEELRERAVLAVQVPPSVFADEHGRGVGLRIDVDDQNVLVEVGGEKLCVGNAGRGLADPTLEVDDRDDVRHGRSLISRSDPAATTAARHRAESKDKGASVHVPVARARNAQVGDPPTVQSISAATHAPPRFFHSYAHGVQRPLRSVKRLLVDLATGVHLRMSTAEGSARRRTDPRSSPGWVVPVRSRKTEAPMRRRTARGLRQGASQNDRARRVPWAVSAGSPGRSGTRCPSRRESPEPRAASAASG